MFALRGHLRRWCSRVLTARLRERLRARSLARTTKRLDFAASQMAMMLHFLGRNPFEGKEVAEIGAGWVLSHSCCAWLLGARRIDAYDIASEVDSQAWRAAILSADAPLVRDVLAPFAPHQELRRRLVELQQIAGDKGRGLDSLPLVWHGGHDLTSCGLARPVSVIWSFSVLEHLDPDLVPAALRHLRDSLASGGIMFHGIHLEDHLDLQANPFAFLAANAGSWSPDRTFSRGNRLRASQWERHLSIPGLSPPERLFAWRRPGCLPANLAPPFAGLPEDDLDISHLGILSSATS